MGLSYAAHTQMALACLTRRASPRWWSIPAASPTPIASGIRQGGAFELKQATWAYNNAQGKPAKRKRDPVLRAALEAEDIRAWFAAMPWSEGRSPVRGAPGIRGLSARAMARRHLR